MLNFSVDTLTLGRTMPLVTEHNFSLIFACPLLSGPIAIRTEVSYNVFHLEKEGKKGRERETFGYNSGNNSLNFPQHIFPLATILCEHTPSMLIRLIR